MLPAESQAGTGHDDLRRVALQALPQPAGAGPGPRRAVHDGRRAVRRSARTAGSTIGDYCYFTNAVLLCELALRIGNYVVIGWNTTIADTDFHPMAPALRIADAVAVLAARPGPGPAADPACARW